MRKTSHLTRPAGILFDLGGTLVGTEFCRDSGFKGLLELIPKPHDVTHEKIRKVSDEIAEAAYESKKETELEVSRSQFDRNLFDRLGVELHLTDEELDRAYLRNCITHTPEPGVFEMLELVNHLQIKTGIVSNSVIGGTALDDHIDKLGLLEKVGFVMSSADYGFRKPHPEIFKTAVAKLGLKPGEVWFAGDFLYCDIEGAKSSGLEAIWYNTEKLSPEDCKPNAIVHDWYEFCELLKNIFPDYR